MKITAISTDGQPVAVDLPTISATLDPQPQGPFPVGTTTVTYSTPAQQIDVEVTYQPPRIGPSDFVLKGMFRLPATVPGSSFDFSGGGLAYNPKNHSLFITGRKNDATMTTGQKVAEVSIPTPVMGSTLSALPTATVIQPFIEPTEGQFLKAAISGTPTYIGDYLVVGDELVFTEYAYYDVAGGTGGQQKALFARPLDFTVKGQVRGPFGVVSTPTVAFPPATYNPMRFTNVYLLDVPQSLWSTLGGPHGIGATPANGSASGSNGQDLFITNLTTLSDPQPISPKLYFPQGAPLGPYGQTSDMWNSTVGASTSVEIIDGTRTMLGISHIGVGKWAYGNGTSDLSLDGTYNSNGVLYCYDPTDSSKGPHAYPYVIRFWAWDIDQIVSAAHPWDARPYAAWNIDLPFTKLPSGLTGANALLGVAYDHVNQQLFLTVYRTDGDKPLVYVLERVKK
jgi:hypothetical protein